MLADALSNYQPGPFLGPFSIQAMLADGIAAVPYEGIWVPARFAKTASVELSGSISTLSLDIYGTNQLNPLNTYTVTVGGSEHDGDTLNLIFTNPLLPAGTKTVSYVTSGGQSINSIATALAAAVAADPDLSGLGFLAKAASAVVTIQWPSVPSAGAPSGSDTILATSVVGGGATETLTVAAGADGTNLTASHLTALGLTSITPMPVGWVKSRITTLTGGGANISAAFQGVA